MANPNVRIEFHAVNRTGGTLRQVDRGLDRLDRQARTTGQSLTRLGSIGQGVFESLGFVALDAARGFARFGVQSVRLAGDLQALTNTLASTTGSIENALMPL